MRGQFITVPVLEAAGRDARRPFRLEEPARQPALLLRRRLPERDGHHQPAAADGEHVDGNSVGGVRRRARSGADDRRSTWTIRFARFMRSTKAPPRDTALAATADAVAGARCSTRSAATSATRATITTAPPGTVINGGTFTVPAALGDKLIHPFSDFLLHDVGTGDGIVQNGGASTRNKVRTAAAVGPAHPRPVHARRAQPEHRGRDQPPRQSGAQLAPRVQSAQPVRSAPRAGLPQILVRKQEAGIGNQGWARPDS